jgi:hypothetical protein
MTQEGSKPSGFHVRPPYRLMNVNCKVLVWHATVHCMGDTLSPTPNGGSLEFRVMPDGQHFLMLLPAGAPFQIQVTLNWVEELKARVPIT